MKFKDLMLDLATGDASSNDPYIAEAAGQVNVATAYFEAAVQINELVEDNDLQVVQEVAAAGLPTDETGSAALGCTAVKKQLEGFFKVVRETADKVKKQAEKDMKVLLTIGKKYGVSAPSGSGNFTTDFAEPLSKAVFQKAENGKKISLPDLRFLKTRYADDIVKGYVKGLCSITFAYGFDISEVFKDAAVSKEINQMFLKKGECKSLGCVAEALSDGARFMKFGDVAKDKHYTDTIKPGDVKDLATNLYIIIAISSAVTDALKGQDKNAASNIAELIKDCNENDKKIAKPVKKIGENVKDWTAVVQETTNAITKAFTDSIYSLSEALK